MGYKSLVRTLALASLSALVVYAFIRSGVVDLSTVQHAFAKNWHVLVLDVACLIIVIGATVVRHKWILSTLLPVSWGRVAGANVISVAIGHWAPGSMAVTEVARAGLLFAGTSSKGNRIDDASRLAVIAAVDRAIGTGVMFCFGSGAAIFCLLFEGGGSAPRPALWMLAGASLSIGVTLCALPLSADTRLVSAFARLLRRSTGHGAVTHVLHTIARLLEQAGVAAKSWRQLPGTVLGCFAASLVVNIFSPLGYYLTSVALGDPVPFAILAAVSPLTIIAVVLPLGFAGFGGPQLVWVASFALFGVSAQSVLSMTLVQNTVILVLYTVSGLAWSWFYWDSLRVVLHSKHTTDGAPASAVDGT